MSWQHRFEVITGSTVAGGRKLAGGDLGGATLVDLADGRQMVAKSGKNVEIEADMLRAIARTGAPAPEVFHAERELLVMEYVEADGEKDWLSLAEALGHLHAPRGEPFGWDSDYAFGKVAIANSRSDNWPQFWAEHRLECHAAHIDSSIARRLEVLAKRLPDLLPIYPTQSLLHGDLWGGNVLFHQGRLAALIDPAAYVGHREVDVAMLTLFDHPPHEFFEAMQLEEGWRTRLPIYRLWPLLVHLRLFGDGYRDSVTSAAFSVRAGSGAPCAIMAWNCPNSCRTIILFHGKKEPCAACISNHLLMRKASWFAAGGGACSTLRWTCATARQPMDNGSGQN